MNDRFAEQVTVEPLTLLPAPIRWRFLLSSLLVLTAFVLILTVWKIAAGLMPPQADLFGSYRALFPGGDETQLAQYPCTLYSETAAVGYGVQRVMCVLTPENSHFRQVSVFTTGGKITGINFSTRYLRVVDLIWLWGVPDKLYHVGGTYKVTWEQQFNITASIERHYSMQAPVRLIAITTLPTNANTSLDSSLCSGKYGNTVTKGGCNFTSIPQRY